MAHAWHFVSNSLKFHLLHAISECCDSNMSKSKVIYGSCMTLYFECLWHFDSNMSNKSQWILSHLHFMQYLNVLTQICPNLK